MIIRSVTFIVNDIQKSVSFYEKIGFKVLENSDDRICFQLDNKDQQFCILQKNDDNYQAGQQICSFFKSNVDGFFEKCRLMGAPLEKVLDDSPDGRTFAFRDIDGNKIEIMETPLAESSKTLEEVEVRQD